MSAADDFLAVAATVALALFGLAFLFVILRILLGPTLPDRVLGLDTLTNAAVGFIAAFGVATGLTRVVDIAIALGLVGFLATVALARYVFTRGRDNVEEQAETMEPRA